MAGIWAFIIPILVQLVVAFITELLKNLNPPTLGMRSGSPVLPDLVAAKKGFMSKVNWRFWLGPKRAQYASAIYDRMHGKFAVSLSDGALDIAQTVKTATDGLDKLSPADLGDGLIKFSSGGAMSYKVLPNGLVQGGMASYILNAVTGSIAYRASIRVGKWFFSKTYEFQGSYLVDPALLNPTNLAVGKVITIGQLQMKVVSLNPTSAMVSLIVLGQSVTGTAILATTNPVLSLSSLDAKGRVLGLDLVLGLRQDG